MSRYTIEDETPGELHLHDRGADTCVQIAPFRGGLIKRLRVRDHDVLYLDEATFEDRQKNVRGGIPILFPSPGRLAGDVFSIDGVTGALPQHGFLRQRELEVVLRDEEQGRVRLRAAFAASAAYPWAGEIELDITLRARVLRIEVSLTNHAASPMPYALGFHPYFALAGADKADLSVSHQATRAFDNLSKKFVEVPNQLDFTGSSNGELDLHLLDHPGSSMTMFTGGRPLATVRASADFGVWVLWALRGKDFVCVEPWTAPANALNTGEGVQRVAVGETRRSWIEIEATDLRERATP